MKKEVRKAMEKAKELEKKPVPTREEIAAIYKEGMKEAENLQKLLKPQWFVRDDHRRKKKSKKSGKKAKKPGKKKGHKR